MIDLEQIAGIAHEPHGTPGGVVVLTHGAGGNRESPLLQRLCDEWARRGWLAVRYDLPYRRRRPKGPPSGSAATDRAGIVEAITVCRALATGPLIVGGHSYGGRMTSMVIAEKEAHADVLTLANLAQMVNVLHAPVMTEGASIWLTPIASTKAKLPSSTMFSFD